MTQEQFQLKKDNFDLENMHIVSESTNENDDSQYDHWELTLFLPQNLNRPDIENLINKILSSLDAKERLDIQREINSRQIVEISKLKDLQQKLDLKFKNDVIETVQLRNQVRELKELRDEIVDLIRNENVTDGNYDLWNKIQALLKEYSN